MKKLLLSLCALFAAVSMNAQYSVGDYIFTSTAKYKVTKIVDIVQPGAEWNNYSSEIFSPYTAETEDDFDGIKSTRSDEGDYISYALPLEYGANYIVTMKFRATAAGTTSITDGGQNQIDAWASPADNLGVRAGAVGYDYQQVASTATVAANEWTEISWAFSDTLAVNAELEEPGGFLNILFSRINTECVIAANMQVVQVQEVYDTRISDKLIAYAQLLMEDSNFNTDAAADAKAELQGAIELIQSEIAAGSFDDPAQAADFMSGFQEMLDAYLDVESTDMKDYLQYIDIVSFPAYGRGRVNAQQGCFPALLGNWGHLSGTDYLMSAIQMGQKGHTATLNIVNTDFPAGKYFLTAELRNANSTRTSWPCEPVFTLTTTGTTMSVGDNTVDVGTLSGEQYQKFYVVGNVDAIGNFKATIYWPGTGSNDNEGGIFQVRALQVRGFGDIEPQIARKQAWDKFTAQWNAAVNSRNTLIAKKDDANYPWANDSIQAALDQWDPYYNALLATGWIGEDGSDTGVATNDELLDWALYQGYEAYTEDGARIEYAVVRGYQYANNYLDAENKVIADVIAAIADAKATDQDAINVEGDHATYNAVINEAQSILDNILATTNDDKKETDAATLEALLGTLADAKEAFKASAVLSPLVDIDFSGSFQTTTDPEDESIITSYFIDGKSDAYPNGAGRIVFNDVNNVQTDPTVDEAGHFWQLGYGDALLDVLRVGGGANSLGTIEIPAEEIPTDEDVIRAEFDLWLGKLSNGFLNFEARNAADQTIGGFSIDIYNNKIAFNHFNNQTGEPNDLVESTSDGGDGMDLHKYATGIGSSSQGNAAICVDNNKCSFTLIYDFKALALQGKMVSSKGTTEGAEMPMLNVNDPNITDNKVAKFVLFTNYAKANSGAQARRCWFDNLKIYKYASTAEGPHFEPTVQVLKGDVNEDGAVNINDVVAIINVMAGTAQWPNADVNGDDAVNINDVVSVINIMAGNQ